MGLLQLMKKSPRLTMAAGRHALRMRMLHTSLRSHARVVNAIYKPGTKPYSPPPLDDVPQHNPSECACSSSQKIADILDQHNSALTDEDAARFHSKHGLMTWTNAGAPGIHVTKAKGVYFWDVNGQRYMDFNSMAMCCNHGHTIDPTIIDAVTQQIKDGPYAYPGLFVSSTRGRLCKLLADICPGDLDTFMFPSSGTEAVEGAIRFARRYTGKSKIMSRHRSYHGHTTAALAATGDFRRYAGETLASGDFVKFFDPYPYSFSLGETEEEITAAALAALAEQIQYEGPHTIAAILVEAITGTNGILIPPKGYLEGVRALCNEHGMLMICDEVMAGFGRTGKLFGFCHAPTVIPDLFTFAKGVNGAVVPVSGIGMRAPIAEFFRENPHMVGSTYHSHPVALASAYAAIKVMLRDGLVEKSAKTGVVMQELMNELLAKHPSIKQARAVGLFGGIDIQRDQNGTFIGQVHEPLDPAMVEFKTELYGSGVFTMMRGHTIFVNPPLVITEEELRWGFQKLDNALYILDNAMDDA